MLDSYSKSGAETPRTSISHIPVYAQSASATSLPPPASATLQSMSLNSGYHNNTAPFCHYQNIRDVNNSAANTARASIAIGASAQANVRHSRPVADHATVVPAQSHQHLSYLPEQMKSEIIQSLVKMIDVLRDPLFSWKRYYRMSGGCRHIFPQQLSSQMQMT